MLELSEGCPPNWSLSIKVMRAGISSKLLASTVGLMIKKKGNPQCLRQGIISQHVVLSLSHDNQCLFPSSCFVTLVSGGCFDLRIKCGKVLIPLAPPVHTKNEHDPSVNSCQQEETKATNYKMKNKSLVSRLKSILILKETSSPTMAPKIYQEALSFNIYKPQVQLLTFEYLGCRP